MQSPPAVRHGAAHDSALSITQGPAIATKRGPPKTTPPTSTAVTFMKPIATPAPWNAPAPSPRAAAPPPNQSAKQRMTIERARFQLRMELAAKEPRMGRQFHDLDQRIVGRGAGRLEASLFERLAVVVVHFVAMAMTFGDDCADKASAASDPGRTAHG